MSELGWTDPKSDRIQRVPGAVVVFTPCHGRRVFFPPDQAVAGAKLRAVCATDGVQWRLELVPDEGAEEGLRPEWAVPQTGEGEQDG